MMKNHSDKKDGHVSMTSKNAPSGKHDRQKKLAAALKRNLLRRKQADARNSSKRT